MLKIILSNTNSLSKYLQGKIVDLITARRTDTATKETLTNCRDEENFESVWKCAEKLGETIKEIIQLRHTILIQGSKSSTEKKGVSSIASPGCRISNGSATGSNCQRLPSHIYLLFQSG